MSAAFDSTALRCLDCGKCTSVCPVARHERALSPRRLMRRLAAAGPAGGVGSGGRAAAGAAGAAANGALWACLTCMQCDRACPQEVSISAGVPTLRRRLRAAGAAPAPTRCSAMESIAAIQSQADLPQDRLGWLPDDVRTDPEGRTLLWVGCAPYFDAFFADKGVRTTDATVAAIRLLNALDIAPRLLADERCCGHDALWAGDEETFLRLAERNARLLAEAAPERIVTLCPECQLTLSRDQAERFGPPAPVIQHLSELLAERAGDLALAGGAGPLTVTFQDPCRLGRHQGQYEAPRRALAAVPGVTLQEMPRARATAICCAGSWLNCGQTSRRLQQDRLAEAAGTGAEVLVTACPKCLVHLKCASSGDGAEAAPEIRDLAEIVAGSLPAEERG